MRPTDRNSERGLADLTRADQGKSGMAPKRVFDLLSNRFAVSSL
jgi:hypothetical protein